ncbi:MAG: alpha-E domain-containing protein [Chlorobia bacterium]|nr:alpha-E domain-containing protein [Fimbriimonadaceae bacterium]
MLSRHADSAFWIGRYIERAEATARMIDVHYHYGLESPLVGETLRWSSILAISDTEKKYRDRYKTLDERNIIHFFAFDQDNPSSIASSINFARENARSIRDAISSEMWQTVNKWYLGMRSWNVDTVLKVSPHSFFTWVKNESHLFQGITNRTLMMGETRDFHDAGRFLERADQSARILDVKYHDLLPSFTKQTAIADDEPIGVGGTVDDHGWLAVLKSVGAFEMFRKTYHEGVTAGRVAEFLILNPKFPASVRHSIGRVDGCLKRISSSNDSSPRNRAERSVGKLYQELNYMSADEIIGDGLHEFLDQVQNRCTEIGEDIRECYLRI